MMMATQVAGDKRRTFDGLRITGTGEGCNNSSAVASASRGKRLKTSTKGIYNPTKEKDKTSEKIATLQQLVCPFGKTDTASILEEATGYIKFLHDQLQVLSAPYLQTPIMQNKLEAENNSLRSRGLCLMPVSSTSWIARSNGADMWAPMNTSKHL